MKDNRRKFLSLLLALIFIFQGAAAAETANDEPLAWQDWDKNLFKKARSENRFVILDLEAVWCHWCHVMAETTYRDGKVVELINSRYIPVRVDQDANPDLAHRYEEYGWPATIIFGPDGQELAKRRGYIPPDVMASLLQAVIDDPTPGPSVRGELEVKPSENAFLTPEQKQLIFDEHFKIYDKENGGWGDIYKLIDENQMEYALLKAQKGDKQETDMARKTLDNALHLLDPVWGGFYQYSDQKDWQSPHYEKIMSIQAGYIRLYTLASLIFKEPKYLKAALETAHYIRNFWTDKDGGIYTSQDADVSPLIPGKIFYSGTSEDRRKLGMPRIDNNIYSRENGWAITALTQLYNATGDAEILTQARRAAEWIKANRRNPDGGFRHDQVDRGGPYLGDSLSMARAFLSLYISTSDRPWLEEAVKTADYMEKTFMDREAGGFVTSASSIAADGVLNKPVRQYDENIAMARFANLLFHYTGNKKYREMAEWAMKYIAAPANIQNRRFLAGVLVADEELASDPDHVTIVAKKDDPAARPLFMTALAYPAPYKRVEWWDKRDGPLPNPDVEYPELPRAAAFACANQICSLPVFDGERLIKQVERLKSKTA